MNKKTYEIYVKETVFSERLDIEAKNKEEAVDIVNKMLDKGQVPMDDLCGHFNIEIDGIVCSECGDTYNDPTASYYDDNWLCKECFMEKIKVKS